MYQNRISIIGFVGNDAQLRSTKNGATVAVFFRRHQIVVEKPQGRLRLPDRLASLRGLGIALPIRGEA